MSKSKKKGNQPAKSDAQNKDVKKADVKEAEEIEEVQAEESEAEENEDLDAPDTEEVSESEAADSEESEESEEAEEEETEEEEKEPEAKEISNAEFAKLSFTEKCKKDPVIPVCIILAIVMIGVATLYFMLPNIKAPSMGMTAQEFRENYRQGEIAIALYQNALYIGFGELSYVNPKDDPSILGDRETYKVSDAYVDYFKGYARNFSNSGIEGAARKSDGNLAYVRVYSKADFEPAWFCFSNFLEALYPGLGKYEAMNIALNEVNDPVAEDQYTVRGDFAFKWYAVHRGEMDYFVIEAVPKSALKQSQIGRVLEMEAVSAEAPTIPESEVDITAETT